MEPVQNMREKDLERAETLLQQAKPNVELEVFDEATVKALEEAMELFEKWEVEEKMAEVYEYWGRHLQNQENFITSVDFFQKSLEIRLKLYGEKDRSLVKCSIGLGKSEISLGNQNKGKKQIEKALSIAKDIPEKENILLAHAYEGLALYYFHQKKYKNALNSRVKGLKIAELLPDSPSHLFFLANVYANLGTTYLDMNELSNSKPFFEKAIEIYQKILPPNHRRLGMVYTNYSSTIRLSGDINYAIVLLKKSLAVFLQNQADSVLVGYVYFQLALNYGEQFLFRKTIEYYQKALPIFSKPGREEFPLIINIYIGLGDCHRMEKEIEAAEIFFKKALKIAVDYYGEESISVVRIHKFLGVYHIANNQPLEAQKHLYIALEKYKNIKENQVIDLADIWVQLGHSHRIQQQFLSEIQCHHKAFAIHTKQNYTPNIYDYYYDFLMQVNFLTIDYLSIFNFIRYKANAFFSYYCYSSKSMKDLQAALDGYKLIFEIGKRFLQSFHSEETKLIVKKHIYTDASVFFEINNALFELTQNRRYTQYSFELFEKNKAYLLLESIQAKLSIKKSRLPVHLREQETKLKKQLILLQKNIQTQEQGQKTEKKLLQKHQDDYFNAYNEFESLKKQLETDYPDYYLQKYSTKIVSISSLQSSLQSHQTVLSYFIGEEKIYLFAITSDEYEVFAMEKPDNWTGLIHNYLQSIKFHQKEKFQQLSFELYQILLQEAIDYLIDPFEDETRQVFIIPHAELHYLPFETIILSEADKSMPYSELDYLLNHCQISYHYSATLLHLDLQKQTTQAEPAPTEITFTGFAPVYETTSNEQKQALELMQSDYATAVNRSEAVRGDGTWLPLPHSKIEVENIAQLFEQQGLNSQAFLHEAATKHNLEEQIGKSRFVLIAAHGIVNDEFPELSGLVLAESGGRQTINGRRETVDVERSVEQIAVEDCILNMKEVAMIPMNADLVVLSSCESGIGELHKGEGMMAVNRGFLASGAKNVVSTLFKVNDRASSELTQLMFRYILESLSRGVGRESYATALQKAKLDLLKRKGMSPKMWSGFVLFGTGEGNK